MLALLAIILFLCSIAVPPSMSTIMVVGGFIILAMDLKKHE